MRITDKILQNSFISNLSFASERLYESEMKVLTNKAINKPSDNPVDTITSLAIRTKISQIEQYQRNISNSQTLLKNTETVVNDVLDQFDRVNSLTVQGASDNYSLSDKISISSEVNQIIEQVFNLANNRSESTYTFAGTRNDTAPYQAVRNDTGEIVEVKTTGSAGDINGVIGENIKIKVNVNGEDLFEGGQNLFDTLIKVRDDLRANDTNGLRQDLTNLSSASEKIINIQSVIGARVNRIDSAESRAEDNILNFTEYLSKIEDVDASQAIIDYQTELVTLQSSLQAWARLLYPKLSDFLK
jgi:flagellar hook-associated protein 3 FlgL